MYLIQYGTINEQRRKLPLTTSRITNPNEAGGAT